MAWKLSWGIVLLILLAVAIGVFRNKASAQQKPSTVFVPTPEGKEMSTYLGMRNLALTVSAAKAGEPSTAKPNEPLAVLMDLPTTTRTATIVAYADGTASIYTSSGVGYLGGSQKYPAIHEAAVKMLAAGRRAQAKMQITRQFPLPDQREIVFYVVMENGVFTARVPQEEFKKSTHPLSELYAASQEVITQYRLNVSKP
jgi:hypothetical protein